MSIEYYVRENKLTVPISYTARPQARTVLQYADMASRISLKIPNITPDIAENCLRTLALIVKDELLNGNTVNLTNFVSFITTIPVRLPLSTDLLPPSRVSVVAKPSPVFTAEVAAIATYTRLGVEIVEPVILSAADSATGLNNWMREGFMLDITGANLNFNEADQEQGLFFLSPAGNTIRAANIAWLTDKKIIAMPEIDPVEGPAGKGSVEYGIKVKARYSPAGFVKTAEFNLLRKTNVIDTDNSELFVKGSASSGPAIVSGYTGDPMTARIIAKIRPDNVLTISAGELLGDLGQAAVISGNGTYQISGIPSLEIQVVDYNTLYANVIQYQRYLQEVVELNSAEVPFDLNFGSYTTSHAPAVGYSDVEYSGSLFMALALVSSNVYRTYKTTNGIDWISNPTMPSPRAALNDICFGGSIWIVTSSTAGYIFWSADDGATWNEVLLPQNWFPLVPALNAIAYGGNNFVGLSSALTNPQIPQVYISTNGQSWSWVDLPVGEAKNWSAIAYGDGVFVGVGRNSTRTLRYTNGVATTAINCVSRDWRSIAYGDGKFVAISNATQYMISTDAGLTWTESTFPNDRDWETIKYFGGKWTVVGTYGTADSLIESTDLITWTAPNVPQIEGSYLSAIAGSDDGIAVAVCSGGSNYSHPRAFANFNQSMATALRNNIETEASANQEMYSYFKISVPAEVTQITLQMSDMVQAIELYAANGYLPSRSYYEFDLYENGQIVIQNTGENIYGVSVYGYDAGTNSATLKITLS